MRKLPLFACAIAISSMVTVISRADPSAPVDQREFTLVPMKKGDVSLYDGVLLLPEAIAVIVADREQFDDRLNVELARIEREHAAKLRFELTKASVEHDAERKILLARTDGLSRRLQIVSDENKKLSRSATRFRSWTIVGFATGVLVGALAVIGVERAVH